MGNKRMIINWILLIAWMLLIFLMSNQPAHISNQQSNSFINMLAFFGIDLNSKLGSLASFVVRKTAHFTEYFILYWLAFEVGKNYIEIKKARNYFLTSFNILSVLLKFNLAISCNIFSPYLLTNLIPTSST